MNELRLVTNLCTVRAVEQSFTERTFSNWSCCVMDRTAAQEKQLRLLTRGEQGAAAAAVSESLSCPHLEINNSHLPHKVAPKHTF